MQRAWMLRIGLLSAIGLLLVALGAAELLAMTGDKTAAILLLILGSAKICLAVVLFGKLRRSDGRGAPA